MERDLRQPCVFSWEILLPKGDFTHTCISSRLQVSREVALAAGSPSLAVDVASGCAAAVRAFADRLEGCGGQRALGAACAAESAHASLSALVAGLPAGVDARELSAAAAALLDASTRLVTPHFRAAGERIDAAAALLHSHHGDLVPGAPSAAAVQLVNALRVAGAGIPHPAHNLPPTGVNPVPPTRRAACALASRALLAYARHAVLLRPFDETTALRCATDLAELEQAAAMCAPPVEAIHGYALVRALRPLFFIEPSCVVSSPLRADLPAAYVLLHLLRLAPPALQSPHTRAGLQPAAYAAWLERASDVEVWRGIAAALDAAPSVTGPEVDALREMGANMRST